MADVKTERLYHLKMKIDFLRILAEVDIEFIDQVSVFSGGRDFATKAYVRYDLADKAVGVRLDPGFIKPCERALLDTVVDFFADGILVEPALVAKPGRAYLDNALRFCQC
jgi:hypothetical protein